MTLPSGDDAHCEDAADTKSNGASASQSQRLPSSSSPEKVGSASSINSPAYTTRYPGLEQETRRICLRESQFDEEQVVRLLLQELHDRGFVDTFTKLQQESGYTLENEPIAQFRASILAGEWLQVEEALQTIGIDTQEARNAALFLVKRQQFLELLEARKLKQALLVLQNELSALTDDVLQLHRLSSLLMCPSPESLRAAADWDGSNGRSRFLVLESLQTYISPGKMVPVHRMETLFTQAIAHQCEACSYHVRPASQGLYVDHTCPSPVFPQGLQSSLMGHEDEVWYLAFSPDGRYLASASRDKTCIIWSMEDRSIVHRLSGHEGEVSYLAWSPNSKTIVSASSDKTLRLWDVDSGDLLQEFDGHDETVTSCRWLGDNDKFISGGMDHKIIIWSTNGSIIKQISSPRVHDLAVSVDRSLLLVADEKTDIHAYDLATLTFLYNLREPAEVMSLALSSDAQYCITGLCTGELHMWDLNTRLRMREFSGHAQGKYVIRCAFAGLDDCLITTGSEDGLAFVWNRDTGKLLARLRGHTKTTNVCAWSTAAGALATASDDKTICIWPAYHGAPSDMSGVSMQSPANQSSISSDDEDKSMASGAHSTTLSVDVAF
ncbi:WD40 repeat-like protein [Coemansia reversa NRRL 1564]|uniref:WD40 repeat-like protein n=1 Tax=Coemansia reversa (strain ATCC 12441 / NRRL 1564) TaxID=763665 RepID=A0A2G5BIZ4_COERN|nr:WD40 repeat-like protein [Coemansia reversa NRRL 1564]|eukprot:PIA19004.1 WD40 repeat-like protein [Coemansia reversa NRRL 1564]